MTQSGPPYWAAIWFVIITGTIATAVHLAYGPFPHAARQSRTQSGATHYDPNYDYNNYCVITSSGAIASVSAAMGY